MKKLITLAVLFFISIASFAQQAVEQEVLKAEREWLNAYEQNDTIFMNTLVAEGFLIRYPYGRTETKADLMNMLRRNAGKPANVKLYTEETTASVFGGTVILRGTLVIEEMVGGEKKQQKQFYTDTWVRTEKGWQVVASHLTDVPKPGSGPGGPAKVRKKVG